MKQPTDEEIDRYMEQLFAVRGDRPNRLFWMGTRCDYEEFRAALQQLAKKHGWDKPDQKEA